MTQALIRAAFETKLKTWADAQSPVIRVAWENVSFTPTQNETYVRAYLLRGNTTSADIGRYNRRLPGVFQVSIVMPKGIGPAAGETLFASLEAQFQPQSPISYGGQYVWLTQPMTLGSAIPDDKEHVLPCSVPYVVDRY